jgi:hypothetical protein
MRSPDVMRERYPDECEMLELIEELAKELGRDTQSDSE